VIRRHSGKYEPTDGLFGRTDDEKEFCRDQAKFGVQGISNPRDHLKLPFSFFVISDEVCDQEAESQ